MFDDKLSIHFVNVGYGEAIVLEMKNASEQFCAIIDGGSAEPEEYQPATSGRIPLYDYLTKRNIQEIDLVICTHIHEDHVSGLLYLFKHYRVKSFWQSLAPDFYKNMQTLDPDEYSTKSQRKFVHALNDYKRICELQNQWGNQIVQIQAGDHYNMFSSIQTCAKSTSTLTLDTGISDSSILHVETPDTHNLQLEVLAPSSQSITALETDCLALYQSFLTQTQRKRIVATLDANMNNLSLILRLKFGETIILLPGDTNKDGYSDIASEELRSDIFKLGHHGQADSMDLELLEIIQPSYVICCASSDQRYNSADSGVLRMLAENGAILYYSDCPPVAADLYPAPQHEILEFEIKYCGEITATYI